eukprot:gene7529-15418_t
MSCLENYFTAFISGNFLRISVMDSLCVHRLQLASKNCAVQTLRENVQMDNFDPDHVLDEIFERIEDTKLLAADKLYSALLDFLSSSVGEASKYDHVRERLKKEEEAIDLMNERVKLTKECLGVSDVVSDDDGWIYAITLFGVSTHYKSQADGSLLLRLQGSGADLPLFEQVAVVHEADLYPKWVPFCSDARTVTKITHADLIVHMNIQMPMLSREAAVRFNGVDCLNEQGTVIFLGESVDQWVSPAIPWKPTGWFHDRMIISEFKAIVRVESPSSAKIIVIASLDPRAPIPVFLRNFIIRNFAGILVSCMQTQAKKIIAEPEGDYGQRMRNQKEFYVDYLLPKLRTYCDFKQWPQPNIPALGLMGLPTYTPPTQHGQKTAAKTTTTTATASKATEANSLSTDHNNNTNTKLTTSDNISSTTDSTKLQHEVENRILSFKPGDSHEEFDPHEASELIKHAVEIFQEKKSLIRAIKFLAAKGFIAGTSSEIASFLIIYGEYFNKNAIGELISDDDIQSNQSTLLWSDVRYRYIRDANSFINLDIEKGVRKFLTTCGFNISLSTSSPDIKKKIKCLLETFAQIFFEDNPASTSTSTSTTPYTSVNDIFHISQAMLDLNYNMYHNLHESRKFSQKRFVSNIHISDQLRETFQDYFYTIFENISEHALDEILDINSNDDNTCTQDAELVPPASFDTVIQDLQQKEFNEALIQVKKIIKESDKKPVEKVLKYLYSKNTIKETIPDTAKFLITYRSLFNAKDLGEYLGSQGKVSKEDRHRRSQIRYRYIRSFSFFELQLEVALRKFMSECGFILPKNGQNIDLMLQTFARVFWEDNHDTKYAPFKHVDTVHLLALAVVLLDNEFDNPDDIPTDLDNEYLSTIYDNLLLNKLQQIPS